jgi:hypothetical protein
VDHREFLLALRSLTDAYTRLDAALVAAAPPPMGAVLRMDALSRAAGEEFAHPVVRWFRRGSTVRGVAVADGTLVLDVPPGGSGPVLFLAGVSARDDGELPAGWRTDAVEVAWVDGDVVALAGTPPA